MNGHRWAVGAVWAGSLLAATITALVVAPAQKAPVLTLVLAVSVVVGLAVQLVVGEREGFVERLAASVSGSAVIVVATAVVTLAASGPAAW